MNTVGAATAVPRSDGESQPLLLLGALWHYHDEKKSATMSRFWAALVPNFEDLRETVMHAPVCIDCPSVLKRNGGDMARFSEETGIHCLLWAA